MIGRSAGLGVLGSSTGGSNVLVGRNAGLGFTTMSSSVAIGQAALQSATTPTELVAIGYEALNVLTTGGTGSTAVGYQSGKNTTGISNTFAGAASGVTNTTGVGSVAVGFEAMKGAVGSSPDYSVALGFGALKLIETGDYNICVGYQAGDLITTGSNNVIIGKNIDPSGATVSDELRIASAIYGTSINSASAKVGIGLAAPNERLSVDGNFELATAGNKIKIATGTNASVGTATLVAGTVTVNTTAALTASLIFVSCNTPGGTQGLLSAPSASITNATSFVINSSSNADTSTVNWWIIN